MRVPFVGCTIRRVVLRTLNVEKMLNLYARLCIAESKMHLLCPTMKKRQLQKYRSRAGLRRFLKAVTRQRRRHKLKSGALRHALTMKRRAEAEGRIYQNYSRPTYRAGAVEYSNNVKFLASFATLFSNKKVDKKHTGHFIVPRIFSLLEKFEESFDFLKQLFFTLYRGRVSKVYLDFGKCERIDVDASICMDVILADFIDYIKRSRQFGNGNARPAAIIPRNFNRDNIEKVLYSIGAFKNLLGVEKKFADVEALPVLINYKFDPRVWENSEVHLTKIVEYIKKCLIKLNRELTTKAETEFYKVIGEVMSNAEEHGTMPYRFAIGFFQETHEADDHFGIFNFSILNFGDTIYQTFKSPTCKNPKAVSEMMALSEDYTKRGWFRSPDFEEETLWTLYAMQEGVTSKEKKRGNGSIQYIENFFKLKGGMEKEETSKLVVHSGHSRIVFDGTYYIVGKHREGERRPYKMITFNNTNDIGDIPDKKYVTFVPHYFPGTLISARILIKYNNTIIKLDGTEDLHN